MNADTSKNNQLVPISIDSLSFDSFGRNPNLDIVCVSPIRTIVRREEEIVLIRRVRKVEEIEAGQACPVNSVQVSQVNQQGQTAYTEEKKN